MLGSRDVIVVEAKNRARFGAVAGKVLAHS